MEKDAVSASGSEYAELWGGGRFALTGVLI